jgi:hypothetical protein
VVATFNALKIAGLNDMKQTAGVDWCLAVTEIIFVENCI